MLKRFQEYIQSVFSIPAGSRILVAVSGGIDSMVLLHLIHASGFKAIVAHCNFGLRGKESDDDEALVRETAAKYNLPFFIEFFQTAEYARARKISIQMAARELRYEWLEQIRSDCDYSCIAIAHNLDDNIETMLLNLTRGTGIKGLSGIPMRSGYIIRPLLFAKREEIQEYARTNNISFREDSSNTDDKYRRNFIRHKIIPLFRELNPSFTETAGNLIENLNSVKDLYLKEMQKLQKMAVEVIPGETRISIQVLREMENPTLFLHEYLSPLGFSPRIIYQVVQTFDSEPGKIFYSSTHKLIKDRDFFLLAKRDSATETRYYIDEDITELHQPLDLFIEIKEWKEGFIIPGDSSIACLDFHELHFPLILRKWQKGDYFQPLGLQGLKKLSDFFIDKKLSLIEKANTWVLASGNKIVWVIGHRIDERFKIKPGTSKIWLARMNTQFTDSP